MDAQFRRLVPLFVCQFLSAFSDNLLKNGLVFLALATLAGSQGELMVTIAGGVFILPFFLLSALGGELADKIDKARVIRAVKGLEIAAALVAAIGFILSSIACLMGAIALFGIAAAIFGPVKYAILPDQVASEDLPAANAWIEGSTFLAIIGGAAAAALVAGHAAAPIILAVSVVVLSLAAYAAARFVPATPPGDAGLAIDRNIVGSTMRLLHDLKRDPRLWYCSIATSLFWFAGAVAMGLLAPIVVRTFGGANPVLTAHLAAFAIAVAIGSALAGWLCKGRVVLITVPLGLAGMALTMVGLAAVLWWVGPPMPGAAPLGLLAYLAQPHATSVAVLLVIMALAGGLVVVPAMAALQAWSDIAFRSRVIGAVNILNAAFMVGSAVLVAVIQAAGFGTAGAFAGAALVMLGGLAWAARRLPSSAVRDTLAVVLRLLYRIDVRGIENLAVDRAGVNPVIVLNHVSFIDAVIAMSVMPNAPVFAIDRGIAAKFWMRPFLDVLRALPLDPTSPLATRSLIAAVRRGDPLVIFPEGRISVTGGLMKVYDGAALVADKTRAKIVPVRLDGPEATPFSRLTRDQVRRRWFPKIVVTILPPLELSIDPSLVGRKRRRVAGTALYDVMSDAAYRTTAVDMSIIEAIASAATRYGAGREAVRDATAGSLSYRRLLAGARALSPHMAALAAPGAAVGLLLPTAAGAAVTVLAVQSAGRVAAMLNFSAGARAVLSACVAAELTCVVTSRAFIEKGKLERLVAALEAKVRIVYLEDVRAEIGTAARLKALLNHRRPLLRRAPDDPAVILFTSGSEGVPKGVVLSSRNILANVAQAAARVDFGRADKLFNAMPVFHSFGLTAGLMLPLISGVPTFLYPSPLHYRIVPELVYGFNATIMFGTDTFLSGYARTANAFDFRSLRYVFSGAEPVRDATRRFYADTFGVRVLEGYGVTETAPVLALNTPLFNRPGSVGRIVPGIETRLIPVPGITGAGRLEVKGPNVMLGYLKEDRPGALQAPGEWYDTGDIVAIDASGFVTIKGRAKRFAKIGGEMVSLAALEALAADLWPDAASAVVAEPDARKGERLIMLTTAPGGTRATFAAFAKSHGAPEIMVPAAVVSRRGSPASRLGQGRLFRASRRSAGGAARRRPTSPDVCDKRREDAMQAEPVMDIAHLASHRAADADFRCESSLLRRRAWA